MKYIRRILFFIIISLFIVTKVNAANATINSWKLHCKDSQLVVGGTTQCYLLAEIESAATNGGDNLTAVLTRMNGTALFIDDVAGATSGITAYKFDYGDTFNNGLEHRQTQCGVNDIVQGLVGGELGCYDFTSQAFLPNTSTPISQGENAAFTPIGVYTVHIDDDSIDPGSSDCAKLCVNVDAIYGSSTPATVVTSDISGTSATCQELHLIEGSINVQTHTCEIVNNNNVTTYYDNNGQAVTEQQYRERCFPACRCENGHCYDNEHKEVSEQKYREACFPACKCENGHCYDNEHKEVSEQKYREACLPVCKCENGQCYNTKREAVSEAVYKKDCFSCKVIGDDYYDEDGNKVSKEDYLKKCNPKCTIIDGTYYNSKGQEVKKEDYEKDCNPKCRCENNQCYNNEGAPISNEEYIKICNPKCEFVNNTYYDNNGKVVTEEEYYKACNPKCRCENNQCYNHEGKPVNNEDYKKICGCRKENGKFYDSDGNEVSEEEWNAKCVPATGYFIRYIVIIGFIALFVGVYYYTKMYKTKVRIFKV